jgi:hypothetical protein
MAPVDLLNSIALVALGFMPTLMGLEAAWHFTACNRSKTKNSSLAASLSSCIFCNLHLRQSHAQ